MYLYLLPRILINPHMYTLWPSLYLLCRIRVSPHMYTLQTSLNLLCTIRINSNTYTLQTYNVSLLAFQVLYHFTRVHIADLFLSALQDSYQSVYNWQYIHCLHLWCRVVSEVKSNGVLDPLIYPLVQTIIGAIK